MSLPNQIPRRDIIRKFKALGWTGPHSVIGKKRGSPHQFMKKGNHKVRIPNPHHQQEIGKQLLKRVLEQAGISQVEWEQA